MMRFDRPDEELLFFAYGLLRLSLLDPDPGKEAAWGSVLLLFRRRWLGRPLVTARRTTLSSRSVSGRCTLPLCRMHRAFPAEVLSAGRFGMPFGNVWAACAFSCKIAHRHKRDPGTKPCPSCRPVRPVGASSMLPIIWKKRIPKRRKAQQPRMRVRFRQSVPGQRVG